MFLSTPGPKSDGMITELVLAQSQSYADTIAPTEDRKGKHLASHKCGTEAIHLHINSYNLSISHYKSKAAPSKSMYENVLQHKQNKVIRYSTYCNVYQTENKGFSRPSQVECENCLSYKDCLVGPDHDSNNCAECIAYAIHKEKYIQARIEY